MHNAINRLPNAPAKILVKLPNYIGDVLMSLPAIYAIRGLLPKEDGYQVDLLTEQKYADLLHGHAKRFDKIIAPDWDVHKVSPWRVAQRIRAKKYDVAISLTRQLRIIAGLRIARVPVRAGYWSLSSYLFYSRRYRFATPKDHESAATSGQAKYYLDLVCRTFETNVDISDIDPESRRLTVNDDYRKEAIKTVNDSIVVDGSRTDEHKNNPDFPKPFYIIVVGTSSSKHASLKRWPLWNFIQVAKRLQSTKLTSRPIPLFLFGPNDGDLYKDFKDRYLSKQADEQERLHGKAVVIQPVSTRVGHLMAIIEGCEFVLSNDTGPRHVATALGKKVVSVFGPTSVGRAVYSSYLEFPVWVNVGCNLADCKVRECRENRICMTAVTPGLVCEKIMEFVYPNAERK